MTIAPAIGLIALNIMLACVAAIVLRKPWMKWFAVGCAGVETAALATLIILTR